MIIKKYFTPLTNSRPANPTSQTIFNPRHRRGFLFLPPAFFLSGCAIASTTPLRCRSPPTRAKLKVSGAKALSLNAIAGW